MNPRWAWRLAAGGLGVASATATATAGLCWYFASLVIGVDRGVTYPLRVLAVEGEEVTLSRDVDTERAALLGLTWPGGHALLTADVSVGDRTVTRRLLKIVRGSLRPGMRAYVTGFVYDGNPRSVHGLDFREVPVIGELGTLPSWYVPAPPVAEAAGPVAPPVASAAGPVASPAAEAAGSTGASGPTGSTGETGSTWVIAVHGRGARPAEALRVLPTLHECGLPTLVMRYRNDLGGPPSPDGYDHLGDTEWRDLAAGIRYAREHGATGIVLYGWSMGGAISMTALRRLPAQDAALIRAVVLDCPVMDWAATLRMQAAQRRLPQPFTWTAGRLAERRAALRLADFDQRRYAPALTVPMLIFVDLDDIVVDPAPTLEFAAARPDLVTLVTTQGGGHTRSWNVDPDGYAERLRRFLARL